MPQSMSVSQTAAPFPDSGEATESIPHQSRGPISDADWLRTRTNRLLDLTDDVASLMAGTEHPVLVEALSRSSISGLDVDTKQSAANTTFSQATPTNLEFSEYDQAIDTINASGRLFVRNLPYSTSEEDLRHHFSQFGELQEVCIYTVLISPHSLQSHAFMMNHFDRDILYMLAYR